jgi:hypothetical protein
VGDGQSHPRERSDGIQIGNERSPEPWPHRVFIGDNVIHDDRENCLDVKKAPRPGRFAFNECYGYTPVSSSDGTAVVVQSNAERIWVLFNHIHDAAVGVRNSSDDEGSLFVVGNMIRHIRHSPGSRRYKPQSAYSSGTGVLAWHSRATIVHNTIWDGCRDRYASGGRPRVRICNNIVGGLKNRRTMALAEGGRERR